MGELDVMEATRAPRRSPQVDLAWMRTLEASEHPQVRHDRLDGSGAYYATTSCSPRELCLGEPAKRDA